MGGLMKTAILALLCAIGSAATVAGPGVPAPATPPVAGQTAEPPVVCSFRNPSYTGLCEERTPFVKDKKLNALCQPILDCLNNPQCVRTYCGSTTVRQGWVLESAKRAK